MAPPKRVPFLFINLKLTIYISTIYMIIDRTIAPEASTIKRVNLPSINEVVLKNNNPVYVVNAGEQAVIKLEIIFDAGNKFEQIMGQSYFCIKMLAEGTENFTSFEIAEKFATIGYFIEFAQGAERAVITLNGLTKHLEKALLILVDLITQSNFPEKELLTSKSASKQNLIINLEKTAYLASVAFKENLFGKNHYIGKSLKVENIDQLNKKDLITFFENRIKHKPFKVFASGKINQQEIDSINNTLGSVFTAQADIFHIETIENNHSEKNIYIQKAGAIQSSIRIGRKIIDRSHPDYFALKVANTILGGFFGSRLMKNIREEKGFTYGISSSHLPIPNYAYMLIGTDVKGEFTQNTISEIYKEMEKLQNEKVPVDELDVVKNFLAGDYAGSINTAFDIAEKQKVIIFENLSPTFFDDYIQKIMAIKSQNVLEIAQKYFSKESMIEIVAGG
jgi:zinc protease